MAVYFKSKLTHFTELNSLYKKVCDIATIFHASIICDVLLYL